MLKEIRDEEELKRVWKRLHRVSDELFYMERMDEAAFVSLFLGGSRLYEGDGGVVFVFAENPHAVKIGAAAYAGRIRWGYFKRTFELIRDELAVLWRKFRSTSVCVSFCLRLVFARADTLLDISETED